jgi:hypothetical protein
VNNEKPKKPEYGEKLTKQNVYDGEKESDKVMEIPPPPMTEIDAQYYQRLRDQQHNHAVQWVWVIVLLAAAVAIATPFIIQLWRGALGS